MSEISLAIYIAVIIDQSSNCKKLEYPYLAIDPCLDVQHYRLLRCLNLTFIFNSLYMRTHHCFSGSFENSLSKISNITPSTSTVCLQYHGFVDV